MYLQRSHDITISPSGVWRILKKAGVNRLPSSQRYKRKETRRKRYEKQRPGHQLQVDVKFIEPLGQTGRKKRYYQYTAIDDCTLDGARAFYESWNIINEPGEVTIRLLGDVGLVPTP